jgi:hypothetical protein
MRLPQFFQINGDGRHAYAFPSEHGFIFTLARMRIFKIFKNESIIENIQYMKSEEIPSKYTLTLIANCRGTISQQ